MSLLPRGRAMGSGLPSLRRSGASTVLDANCQQYKIRLAGIDAPEANHAYGMRSSTNPCSCLMGSPRRGRNAGREARSYSIIAQHVDSFGTGDGGDLLAMLCDSGMKAVEEAMVIESQ